MSLHESHVFVKISILFAMVGLAGVGVCWCLD